jgi:hypothetical protein
MVTLALNGCVTSWQPQQAPPAQLLAATGETRVQVRLVSGTRVVLRDPAVEGDSLVGWEQATGGRKEPPVRRAFALAQIQAIATRGNEPAANVALGIVAGTAIVFAVVGTLLAICFNAGNCD